MPSLAAWTRRALLGVSLCLTAEAFAPILVTSPSVTSITTTSTSALFAKSRKARRMDKQQVGKSRPQQFYDALDDAEGKEVKEAPLKPPRKSKTGTVPPEDDDTVDPNEAAREARAEASRAQMAARPDVSTMFVDEELGMEVVQQGQNVMDVVTRKAVRLSTAGPNYRLAQLLPGVPPEVRAVHRLDWNTVTVPQAVDALRAACSVTLPDGGVGIPTHPSIANKALDFVLANRDWMAYRMERTLGRLTLRTMAGGDAEAAAASQALWKNFMTIENHLSAPFRQMILDAEGRVGPNFGNLDVPTYCDGDVYERATNYLVLKGMVAHWEKKVVDADAVEKNPQTKETYMTSISRGDPRRYLPDPPILFTTQECTQVCYMAQQMTKAFVESPALFNDLPPEIRFVEVALTIKGGTPLRRFVIEEFCPAEEISPEGLREGLRRLVAQLDQMQVDPYGDIVNILERLLKALQVGTDDARDVYGPYVANRDRQGPGSFPTYTFNHERQSLVRFLDSQYEGTNDVAPPPAADSNPLSNLFNFGGPAAAPAAAPVRTAPTDEQEEVYKVPQARAAGRPHELGWLDLLKGTKDENMRLGKVPPGRIIPEE